LAYYYEHNFMLLNRFEISYNLFLQEFTGH